MNPLIAELLAYCDEVMAQDPPTEVVLELAEALEEVAGILFADQVCRDLEAR